MWISTEGVAYYISSFSEGGFLLTYEHIFGWKIQNSTGIVLEDLMFWPDDLESIRIMMPKTYELIKQELEKDEKN